jgi:phosphoglycerol transferase MdoB-like AlkP superfamily enzyme
MPGLFSQRRGTVRTFQVSVCSDGTRFDVLCVFYIILCIIFILFYVLFLYYSMYYFYIILCIISILFYVLFLYYSMYRLSVYVYKPLPPGVYPTAVDKYININNQTQAFLYLCAALI